MNKSSHISTEQKSITTGLEQYDSATLVNRAAQRTLDIIMRTNAEGHDRAPTVEKEVQRTPGKILRTNTEYNESAPRAAMTVLSKLRNWATTRKIVATVVGVATITALVIGVSWGYYRLGHTVTKNAIVKGRVHQIGARVDGQVKTVEVQPGQRVQKDDVLIRLTDDHFQAAYREMKAELRSATKQFEVEKLTIELERQRLALEVERCEGVCRALKGTLDAALSNREKAELQYDRAIFLVKTGVVTPSERDVVSAARDSARGLVETAQGNSSAAGSNLSMARLQVAGLKVREAGLEVLVANMELISQRLAASEADLAATVIRAPEDGWVIDRIVEAGGSAKVGEPMISLWLGAPWIEAWVNEKLLSRIHVGSPVDVSFTAYPNHPLRGRVEAIGVLADKEIGAMPVPSTLHSLFSTNAMVPVRIALPSDGIRLQPGLSAIVGISHDEEDSSKGIDEHHKGPLVATTEPAPTAK